jgi:hypothetical protein
MVEIMLDNPRQYDNMFSELRLGTLLQQSGYDLKIPFENSGNFINWNSAEILFLKNKPGYYHPVKEIFH